jgi:serine/threonine protein kinase/cytoskeletal protein RodZ
MQRFGRYEVIDELGRGAMGVVYRARDTEIGRTVAIKVILTANASPQDIAKYKQRFRREAQAAGRLSHPGIVTIHDIAEDDAGQPYIVMEYIEGKPLNVLLSPAAQVPFDRLLDLGIQVAQALDFAHQRGVVHRDIKPQNILVTQDGRAKIADFGIARMEGPELTQEGASIGTPSYMSPEQFRGGAIDGRTDIFSLGAVLYWMCTGQKPFPGDTVTITSFQVAFENPAPPSLAKVGLPKDLDEIISRCLAKNPSDRYATCGELATDLEAVKAGRPLPTWLGAPPDRTAHSPLPSPKVEPTRSGDTVEVQSRAVSAGQARGAIPTTPPGRGLPAPTRKRNLTLLLAAAGVVVLLALVAAGAWLWRRSQSSPTAPPETAGAPVAAPSAAAPAVNPPVAENTSGAGATPQAPPSEAAASQPAPEIPAAESSAASKTPAPAAPRVKTPRPAAPKASTSATPVPEAAPPPPPSPQAVTPPPAEAVAPAPAALSNLEVDCKFPFDHGTLEITVDGKTLLKEKLDEKRRKLFAGITTSRDFQKKDNPIAVGQHRLRVYIAGKDGKPAWEETLTATIAKDVTSKLEISFKDGSETDPGKRKLVLSLEQVK